MTLVRLPLLLAPPIIAASRTPSRFMEQLKETPLIASAVSRSLTFFLLWSTEVRAPYEQFWPLSRKLRGGQHCCPCHPFSRMTLVSSTPPLVTHLVFFSRSLVR